MKNDHPLKGIPKKIPCKTDNIAPEKGVSQKNSLPTMLFLGYMSVLGRVFESALDIQTPTEDRCEWSPKHLLTRKILDVQYRDRKIEGSCCKYLSTVDGSDTR